MLLNYQDLSPIKKSVEVEIPAEVIAAESSRVTTEFGRQAKLPGFRPGKIPPNVVRTRFAKEIQEEVMSRLLPRSFQEAIREKNVEPVGDPHLEHLDAFIEGAPVKYKAEFEVKPQIDLGEYRGIEIDAYARSNVGASGADGWRCATVDGPNGPSTVWALGDTFIGGVNADGTRAPLVAGRFDQLRRNSHIGGPPCPLGRSG